MSDTIKQAGIKQADGTYLMKDIGVDYSNVDGLDTAATAFKAKSADKATADKNNKDITEYITSGSKSNGNLVLTKGDGTSSSVDLSMRGATPTTNGETGFVPQPASADNNKFLKGDGTWGTPEIQIYQGSDNIDIDSSDNSIDLTNSTVAAGTYGPSTDVTGSNGATIIVPKFTVDAKGRLTSAGQQTYTSVDTQYSAGDGLSQDGTTFSLASHSSSTTGYGPGTEYNYGHVKLSSTYKTLAVGSGIAASQQGLYNAYNELNSRINGNDYTDITADFEDGTFSSNLANYNPGNYIVKSDTGTTYVALLADYNTFHYPVPNTTFSGVNENHWVAIVLGFLSGPMMRSSAISNIGFQDTDMNTWLKDECGPIVRDVFGGGDHIISHGCLLSKTIYDESTHTTSLSNVWEEHDAMLMTEAQLGCSRNSVTRLDPGEAWKPLKIFQNEPFVSVLSRNYGQHDDGAINQLGAWLRDMGNTGGSSFCCVSFTNTLESMPSDAPLARFPIILLK